MTRAKAGRCVHFTGIQNRECRAGVVYDILPKPVCCVFGDDKSACPQYRDPTPEEIAADRAELERLMERMRIVMTTVAKWKTWSKTNRVGKQEVIECPACKGRLHLSQAAYNGHVWGKCETQGCVSWMQ